MKEPDKFRLSASRLKTYSTCSLQGKFKYKDKLPDQQNAAASFGKAVHSALEYYNKTRDVTEAIALFKAMWENPDQYGIEPDYWPPRTSFGSYLMKGKEAITQYHEQMKWNRRTLLGTEVGFLVPFGEYELTGYIDCLELVKDSKGREVLQITDYKTNAKAPYTPELRLNIQFTVYDYASRQPEFWLGNPTDLAKFPGVENGSHWIEFTKNMPRKNVWYGLMQCKEYDCGERDEADYMRLYRCAREIDKTIRADIYVPNISGDSCGFCSFVQACKLPFDPKSEKHV